MVFKHWSLVFLGSSACVVEGANLRLNLEAGGACTDDADSKTWNGGKDFSSEMASCAKKCLGAETCVSSCVQGLGYATGCADCFGKLGACTAKSCWSKCIGGESHSCDECAKSHCDAAFVTCSGLTPPSYAADLFQLARDDKCTGTAALPFKSDALCYSGSESLLGLKEGLEIKVKSLSGGKGKLDFNGSGASALSCPDIDFTITGNKLTVEKEATHDCAKIIKGIEGLYCSDQDAMSLKVKYGKIPLDLTLKRKDCA